MAYEYEEEGAWCREHAFQVKVTIIIALLSIILSGSMLFTQYTNFSSYYSLFCALFQFNLCVYFTSLPMHFNHVHA